MTNLFDMSGKTVLITGGGRGLGYQMAKAFANAGADLIIASRKLDVCDAAVKEFTAMGRRALAVACHVGKWDDLQRLVDTAYAEFGKVDVLINNAGIAPTAPTSAEVTEELFNKNIDVNFKGPFRLSALVGTRMVA